MAEDPAASAGAEAVARLLAEAAAAARRDARDEHAVALSERRDGVADLDDGSDGLVAEDPSRLDLGDVALEDVQVGPADRRGVDADDRVRRASIVGSGMVSQLAGLARGRREPSWLLLSPARRCPAGGSCGGRDPDRAARGRSESLAGARRAAGWCRSRPRAPQRRNGRRPRRDTCRPGTPVGAQPRSPVGRSVFP